MGKSRVDIKQLKKFKDNIDKMTDSDIEKLSEKVIKELAARYLAAVVQVTPVGSYTDGRVGGTLRRGWTIDTNVSKSGNVYQIEVFNPVEYAVYVNNGHRTVNGGWVNGRFFVEIAADQIENKKRSIVERNVIRALREAFNGN